VESTYENVKMTTPEDLIYGKAILESRTQEELT
jgi:2-C-methyl-D-erythritol 4-phosphate cytidylyltransferase